MFIARTKQEIINFISEARQGKTAKIAFVPTMGALHAGHLSLIKLAKQQADVVIASIFVNPTQFGPNEDFNVYPRPLEDDCKALAEAKCNVAFIPDIKEIYDNGLDDGKREVRNADILCGKFRPGHFSGVVQIVGKLFDIVKPDVAIFGEKDFQQLWILKDNFKNINIVGAPIVREADGLAMSSRNKYLSAEERVIAGKLNVVLKNAAVEIKQGTDIQKTLEKAKNDILNSGFTKIDYIEAREEDNLELTKKASDKTRIFGAVWLGKTRLIDNIN